MAFEIEPRVGIGPVRLNMTRDEITKVLGISATRFMAGPFAKRDTDAFDAIGIYVDYDCSWRCEIITAMLWADIVMDGRRIVGRPLRECLEWLTGLDPNLLIEETGLISRKLGICVYLDEVDAEQLNQIKAVHVFREGYYDGT